MNFLISCKNCMGININFNFNNSEILNHYNLKQS